ncbi:hypothetical protein N0V82_000092 [Gnomoniopsis sp. IMI 355080]|nr:hypothetical protein N0V82_000092 [Gnomoniopsis sp. IMI 355080]
MMDFNTSKEIQCIACIGPQDHQQKQPFLAFGTMEHHDDLKIFPDLPRLLGADLYSELFDVQYKSKIEKKTPHDDAQSSDYLPFPADIAADILPSDYRHFCQQSQLKSHGNPHTFNGLSVLQFGLHPDNFQSFQAMTCPLNTDAYAEPVFNCDCGEGFDSLDSVIAHRESDSQHKPWHGAWKAQGQGVCLCGRVFSSSSALLRHIRLATISIRRKRLVNSRRCNEELLQVPVPPRQQKNRVSTAANERELEKVAKARELEEVAKIRNLEEAAKLRRHVTEIDKLIVEATMRQLIDQKEGMAKAKLQANGKISQKQRKQLGKEKAKESAVHLEGDKLQGASQNDEDIKD